MQLKQKYTYFTQRLVHQRPALATGLRDRVRSNP